MKKRSLIIPLILLYLCFMLTACDKDKKPDLTRKDSDGAGEETVVPKENAQDTPSDKAETKEDQAGSDTSDTEREIKRENTKARKAYTDFLADKELAVSDIEINGMLRKGNKYSFSEIIDAYIRNESANIDDEIKLREASYAYIDCGADGTAELAVNLEYTLFGAYNYMYFFRFDDGEIHLFDGRDWGYRSFLTVNEYGYVNDGGSGGANLYLNEYYYYDADCKKVYLYSEEALMGMDSPRIQKYYLKGGYERNDYPDDSYEVGGYTVYTVNFKEYPSMLYEDMTEVSLYDIYYRDQIYSFTDENDRPVKPDKDMIEFYKKEGVKWYSRDELDEILIKHQDELGADKKIREGREASWEIIDGLGETAATEEAKEEAVTFVIKDDHEKPYLNPDNPYKDHEYKPVTLKQISCKGNEITDTDAWFSRAGTSKSGTYFYDDNYWYRLTGDAGYGTMTHIQISDKATGKELYDFDFSDFLYEDGYEGKDFVERGIYNCFITDDLLYLNISHRTYSQDCPVNSFMMCVSVDNGEVMWISRPLTSNSNDFVRYGDNMITGYGFTDEDDFIYILNRYTGQINEKIKVKKSPDYFAFVNGDLWVRTYSYDYEFNIIE